MKTVYVMMSSYNGEKYIREQLDSILAQQGVSAEICVRDDGSSDSTCRILEEYKEKGLLDWYTGPNLRSCKSFLDLLFKAPERDYYAFSDQDDYWHPEKLSAAVKAMESDSHSGAKLYFSKKNIVDSQLKPMNVSDTKVNIVSYSAAVLNCVASGCTMVMNREAFLTVTKHMPQFATMHDAWVYRVINAFGTVIYDENAYIDYRQHGSNVVGADKSMAQRIKAGFASIGERKRMTYRSEGAREMLSCWGDELSPEKFETTKLLSEAPQKFGARLKLIFSSRLKCQSRQELMFLKAFVLLGWI